jgi:hypothetical protein
MEELAERNRDLPDPRSTAEQKRSIRTKFKLSKHATEAKEWLADHWEVSQKEAADLVAENIKAIIESDLETRDHFASQAYEQPGDLVRKTHVVSKQTRDRLESMAEELNLTRDQFFDASLRLTKSIILKQHAAQIEKHRSALERLKELHKLGRKVETSLDNELPSDDPVGIGFAGVMHRLEDIIDAIQEEVRSGEPMSSNRF